MYRSRVKNRKHTILNRGHDCHSSAIRLSASAIWSRTASLSETRFIADARRAVTSLKEVESFGVSFAEESVSATLASGLDLFLEASSSLSLPLLDFN